MYTGVLNEPMHVCVLQRIEGEKGIGKTNWDTHTIFEKAHINCALIHFESKHYVLPVGYSTITQSNQHEHSFLHFVITVTASC